MSHFDESTNKDSIVEITFEENDNYVIFGPNKKEKNNVDDFDSSSESESEDEDDKVSELSSHEKGNRKNRISYNVRLRKKYNYSYTVRQKIEILQEVNSRTEIKRATARKYGIDNSQLHQWQKNLLKLKIKTLENPNAYTVGQGQSVKQIKMEETLNEWFAELRDEDIAITAELIIMQACKLVKGFKGGDRSKLVTK